MRDNPKEKNIQTDIVQNRLQTKPRHHAMLGNEHAMSPEQRSNYPSLQRQARKNGLQRRNGNRERSNGATDTVSHPAGRTACRSSRAARALRRGRTRRRRRRQRAGNRHALGRADNGAGVGEAGASGVRGHHGGGGVAAAGHRHRHGRRAGSGRAAVGARVGRVADAELGAVLVGARVVADELETVARGVGLEVGGRGPDEGARVLDVVGEGGDWDDVV